MRKLFLDIDNEKLNKLNIGDSTYFYIDIFTPSIINDLLNKKEISLYEFYSKPFLEDYINQINFDSEDEYFDYLFDYFNDVKNYSFSEEVFLIYQSVRPKLQTKRMPYIFIPIVLKQRSIKMSGKPFINPLLVQDYNLKVTDINNIYDIDSTNNREKLLKKGAVLYYEAFISNYYLGPGEEFIDNSFIKENLEVKRNANLENYYLLDKQKVAILKKIIDEKNVCVLGNEKSGITNLLINAVIELIKDNKSVTFVDKSFKKISQELASLDLLNLVYDNNLTNSENNIFHEYHLKYLANDETKYLTRKESLLALEDLFLQETRGFTLANSLYSLLINQAEKKIPIQHIETISYDELANIKNTLDKVEKLIKTIDFRSEVIADSYLTNLRVSMVKDEDFFGLLDEANDAARLLRKALLKVERKHKIHLGNNLDKIYELLRYDNIYDLKAYPNYFFKLEKSEDDLIKIYNDYNSQISRIMSIKEMLDATVKKAAFNFDFKKAKEILLGKVYKDEGFAFVEKLIADRIQVKKRCYLIFDYYQKAKSSIEFIEKNFGSENVTLRALVNLVEISENHTFLMAYLENNHQKYTEYLQYYDEYIYLRVFYDQKDLLSCLENPRFTKEYHELTNKDQRAVAKKFKAFSKKVSAQNKSGNDFAKAMQYFSEVNNYYEFENNFNKTILKNLTNFDENKYNYLKKSINEIISSYSYLSANLNEQFSQSDKLILFFKKNYSLAKEYIKILRVMDDFFALYTIKKYPSLKSFLNIEDNISKYLEGEKYIKDNLATIKKIFGSFYDTKNNSFKSLTYTIKNFYQVVSWFNTEDDFKHVNKVSFHNDLLKIADLTKSVIDKRHELFAYFYLKEENYSNNDVFIRLIHMYDHENVKNYLLLDACFEKLRKYRQYNLLADIKDGKIKDKLSLGVELFYYEAFCKSKLKDIEVDHLDDLETFYEQKITYYKNIIYNFVHSNKCQKLVDDKKKKRFQKRAPITFNTIETLEDDNRIYDYILVDNAQNVRAFDYDTIKDKGRVKVIGGYSNENLLNDYSLASELKKKNTYYDINFDRHLVDNSETKKINYYKELDLINIVKDIYRHKKITIVVSSVYDRYQYNEKISKLCKEKLNMEFKESHRFFKVVVYSSAIFKDMDYAVLILDYPMDMKSYHKLFSKILIYCDKIDVYDRFNTMNSQTREAVKKLLHNSSFSKLNELETYFVSLFTYEYEKALSPLNVILKNKGKKLAIKLYFDNQYEYGDLFDDLDKIYQPRIRNNLDIMIINLQELYFAKERVIKRIKQKLGD